MLLLARMLLVHPLPKPGNGQGDCSHHCAQNDMKWYTMIVSLHDVLLLAVPALLFCCREYATANKGVFSRQLLDLASIASISALPQHSDDVLKAADWLQQHLQSIGLENVQV
jgi:hypothetical protein